MIESFKLPNITPETLTGSIVSFNDEYGNLPLKSCTSLITGYQEGSGTPSPDNVRPLHAWSGANLTACGVNLWDEEWELGYISDGAGINVSGNNWVRSKNHFRILPNTTYYFKNGGATANADVYFYDIDKTYLGRYTGHITLYNSNTTFTTPSNAYYMRFYMEDTYGTTYNNDISINYPSTDTDYHAYNGNTYTFTFGQDIYQGSIDWKKGVVVGTWSGKVDMGLLNWGYNSSFQAFYISLPNMYIPTTGQERLQGIANEVYPISTVDAISSIDDKSCLRYNGYLWTKDSDYTDRDDFKNSLIGKYVAYELAEPIEIPLGGINLLTQEGQNNIFCDTGDTEVKFLKVR